MIHLQIILSKNLPVHVSKYITSYLLLNNSAKLSKPSGCITASFIQNHGLCSEIYDHRRMFKYQMQINIHNLKSTKGDFGSSYHFKDVGFFTLANPKIY